MKIYCPDCGNRIEYKAAKKPNFCINCGYKFAGAKVERTAPVPDSEYNDESNDHDNNFDQIKGLEVDLDVSRQKGVKFGDIVGTSAEENGSKQGEFFRRDVDQSITNEQVVADFKKEAGTSRPKRDDPSSET